MMDLIDRQAAIKALEETKQPDPFNRYEYQNIGIDWSIDAIMALPSAQPDVSDTNVGKICEYYDLCRNGRDEKKLREELLSAQPGCEDAVPRASVEYICRKNTVSTNPYEHKYHDKFIQFMDDPEISDFGRWQHSNGFNTALVAVKCDLDKVPSVTPKQPGWIPTSVKPPEPFKLVLIQDYCGCYELNTYIPPRINPKQYPNGYWGEVGTVDFDYFDVEAWCPLPAPYRPEGENSERHDQ